VPSFLSVDGVVVDAQVYLGPGHDLFTVAGLLDKSKAIRRERARAALSARACSTALPIRKN